MQPELKKAIAEYIKEKDPNGDVVVRIAPSEDWKTGEVHYNWEHLGKGRDCGQWNDESEEGAEELVRAYLLVRLIKDLGYPIDKSIVVEVPYFIGHPSRKEARLDVRVSDRRDPALEKSFMLIECKAPEKYEVERTDAIQNQLFRLAPQEHTVNNRPVRYLVYYTVRWEYGQIREEVELINFEEYQNWEAWDAAGQPLVSKEIPANYGTAVISVYVNKLPEQLQPGERLLDKTKDRDFFQRLQKDLHNKLWGGSTEYNYIFKNLARLFLAKIYDEFTTPPGESCRFQVYHKHDPVTGRTVKETPQELFERINQLVKESTVLLGYSETERRNYGIEKDYIDANKVAYVVNQLEGISVVENVHARTGDILGDFFEGIISEGFKQDRGTFFTHKNIVYFILYGLCLDDLVTQLATNPVKPRLPYICDPACGSGTFLIEAMKFVTKHLPPKEGQVPLVRQLLSTWSTDESKHAWAKEFIYGIENNADLALATKVNMVLHLDGNINIFRSDALKPFSEFPNTPPDRPSQSLLLQHTEDSSVPYHYEVNEQFDVVVSNPPFSVPFDPETKKKYRGRFLFAGTRNSEVLFLERYYQLLRPNGRMGVVLPESIFDTAENLPVRLFLYRHFEIWAIVSLPYLAFNPFTSTKTCLLFARKKTQDEVAAFDTKWKEAAAEYKMLRKHPLIAWAIENKKLHDNLMSLCTNVNYAYQPQRNLLHPDNLPAGMLDEVEAAARRTGIGVNRVRSLFKKIDQHFAKAPFRAIRIHSKVWIAENTSMLKKVMDFATSVGVAFAPDEHGHLSPECFGEDIQKSIEDAARAADEATGRKSNKQQKAWAKLQKAVLEYFAKSVNEDLSDDSEARRVVHRFLKSLLDERDRDLPLLDLVDKYLDDIASVGEVNDIFGTLPNQSKPKPFAYANAWWVFGEVMADSAFCYEIFLAEAEEIGYKRGKGNRYQLRRNDLFRCDDPNDLLNAIHPDDPDTILGRLRAHVRKKKPPEPSDLFGGFVTKTSYTAGQLFLRADPKYRFFWDIEHGLTLPDAIVPQVRLRDCLLPYMPRLIPKGKLSEARRILELADVEGRTSIILYEEGNERTVMEVGSTKLDFADCDLVFSRLEPYLGKIVVNDPSQEWIGTSEWIPLKLRQGRVLPAFLKWLLLSPAFLNHDYYGTFWKLRSGKRHARLTKWDLEKLWIPLPGLDRQYEAVKRIEELERQLIEKHCSLKKPVEVIDAVMGEVFGFLREEYKSREAIRCFTKQAQFPAGSVELRTKVKLHSPQLEYLDEILRSHETVPLKRLLACPIQRGVQPEYDDEGDVLVIKTINLKHGWLDFSDSETVNRSFYEANPKAWVKEGDILVSSTGEGRGKVDVYDREDDAIADSHISIVRLREGVCRLYVLYYLQSLLGEMILKRLEIAVKGTPEIYPDMLARAPIIVLPVSKECEIIERISAELKALNVQRDEVKRLRSEIDAVVYQAIGLPL